MMKHSIFFIVPLLATLPLAAQVDPSARATMLEQRRAKLHEKWERQFRAADLDNSRTLSREEAAKAGFPSAILDHFDEIDTDHDGQLSPEELLAVNEKRVQDQQGAAPKSP